MKKIFWIFTLILAISLVSGCGKKSADTNSGNAAKGDGSQMEEFTATMKELAGRGKPYECTYDIKTAELTQNGKIYLSDKNIRGDININMPQLAPSVMHFIKSGDKQYVWNEGSSDGFMMTITDEEQKDLQEQAEVNSDQNKIDYNSEINFKCKNWNVDKSYFNPPSNIKFEDFSALTKNLLNPTDDSTKGAETIDKCAICNMIPAGDAKDACKKQNCN